MQLMERFFMRYPTLGEIDDGQRDI